MFDLDGKEIILDEYIENNKIDDLDDTMDLKEVIEEVKKYV